MDGALRGVFKALLPLKKWDQLGTVTNSRGPSAVCPALPSASLQLCCGPPGHSSLGWR